MKLFIPSVGTKIKLTAPFTFSLYNEMRNDGFMKLLYPSLKAFRGERLETTLPKGTELKIDRVYIRKQSGATGTTPLPIDKDYNSITFIIKSLPYGELEALKKIPSTRSTTNSVRFWVKLSQLQARMEVEVLEDPYLEDGEL